MDSGELMTLVESWFNDLTTTTTADETDITSDGGRTRVGPDTEPIINKLYLHDYCKCEDYFGGVSKLIAGMLYH